MRAVPGLDAKVTEFCKPNAKVWANVVKYLKGGNADMSLQLIDFGPLRSDNLHHDGRTWEEWYEQGDLWIVGEHNAAGKPDGRVITINESDGRL